MPDSPPVPSSRLDRFAPRVRVLVTVVLAVAVLATEDVHLLAAAFAAAVLVTALSGLTAKAVLRRLAAAEALVLLVVLSLPFTTPGEPLLALWGVGASREGLHHAVAIVLTANAVLLLATSLIGTMDPRRMGQGLHGVGIPPVLVHLLLLSGRYVAVLQHEQRRLRLAMKARAFHARGPRAWRAYGHLFGMVLVRSLERAERVREAMACRGFDGLPPRRKAPPLQRHDIALLAAALVAAAALVTAARVM